MEILKKCKDIKCTKQIALLCAKKIKNNSVIAMNGSLGSGKTFFTSYFGKGIGIKEIINSPTFIIMKNYKTSKISLLHIDAYRLTDGEDLTFYKEKFFKNNIVFIEWAHNIQSIIPENALNIYFSITTEKGRNIKFSTTSHKYTPFFKALGKV